MKRLLGGLLAAAMICAGSAPALAQDDYPNKPVRLLIGFPVGGLLDTVSRIVGDKMSSIMGQQFIIDARGGAGGSIATSTLAQSEPDGYTLMMVNDNHALNPWSMKSLPYESKKDFTFIGFVGYTPLVFVAHPSVPAKDVKSLVALAKKQPITYGSVGPGSSSHLVGELLARATKADFQHVPYRGGAPAMADLMAGHVKTMFLSPVIGLRNIEANKLTGLAVAADKRLAILPDLPTMEEAGYPLEASYWFGLMAPAKTPPAVIAKLEKALLETLKMPDVQKRFRELGAVVEPLGSKEFTAYVHEELDRWQKVFKEVGIKPN